MLHHTDYYEDVLGAINSCDKKCPCIRTRSRKMKLRTNFLPRSLPDIAASLFLLIAIPATFWFEIYVVLPDLHTVGSFPYYFTIAAAVFIVFNITANLLAVMLVDTSIKGEVLIPPEDPNLKDLWRLCSICETLTPPRSWHCATCKTCILKRDHHCTFAGYCVGHKNHRYFLMLVTYLFIGTVYASVYNSIYIWWLHGKEFAEAFTFLKMVFPFLILLMNSSQTNIYLCLYVLNLIGLAFGLTLLIYHSNIVLNGSVAFERRDRAKYDLGLKKNVEMLLGKRWYIAWASPMIVSELPHDGIHWESAKNR